MPGINLSNIRSSKEHLKGGGTASRPGELHARRRRVGRHDQDRAARPVAPPRWSSSTPTTPTSRSSSGARRSRSEGARAARRRLRHGPRRQATPTRSSTRTPTTRCASPTSSCRRSSRRRRLGPQGASSTASRSRRCKARDLIRQIAQAAWECADPGMQFDTTINRWHTAPNTGRINGIQPVLRVHAHRQLGVQPRQHQPAEVPRRRRHVRRRGATSTPSR